VEETADVVREGMDVVVPIEVLLLDGLCCCW
jgi:hypothetical protein